MTGAMTAARLQPHDSNATPTSDNSGSTPNFKNGRWTSTSPAMETKKRKYKKRGNTSFIQKKGSKKSKYTYQETVKPRAAKQSANVAIAALSKDTFEHDNEVKLCEEDVQKLVYLFYIKIGSSLPED